MNDLRDLMYRASDGDPNHAADPMSLLQQGRRRVHRRRGITAVSGTAAACLAIIGGVAWLSSTTQDGPASNVEPPVVSGQTESATGAYEPVEVSRAEVGQRCTTFWHNAYGTDATVEVPSFIDGPWFEGQTAQIGKAPDGSVGDGFNATMGCTIPQADLADDAGTMPSLPTNPSDDEIRDDCGQYMGFDFTGWDVITANGSGIALAGVLRSTNGYVAECELNDAVGPLGDDSYVEIHRETPPETAPYERDYAVWFNADQYAGDLHEGDYNIFGVGQIPGPEKAVDITLTEPNGTVHEVSVADNGWYAIAEDMHLEMSPYGSTPLKITVYGEDNRVLAEFADGEQSRETCKDDNDPGSAVECTSDKNQEPMGR
jgi:hypothetical protein